jgi:hypothetical protein
MPTQTRTCSTTRPMWRALFASGFGPLLCNVGHPTIARHAAKASHAIAKTTHRRCGPRAQFIRRDDLTLWRAAQ